MTYATNVLQIRLIPWVVGGVAGLLLARLVARLLAGRTGNGALAALYTVTDPLVGPLQRLDAGQPRFGAVLELSTLALLLLWIAVGYTAWRVMQRWHTSQQQGGRDD